MRFILSVVVALLLVAVGGYALLTSGRWDVAADRPLPAVVEQGLAVAQRASVKARAGQPDLPPLADPVLVEEGGRSYGALCEACHGGPGAEPGFLGRAVSPRPADLSLVKQRWTPAELFWIVKHGLQGTGMPAFGMARVDAELWPVVAFVTQLPGMPPQRYRDLAHPPLPPPPTADPESASPEPPPPVDEVVPPRE
ncbi:MAG: cytochrome c [Magnetospirillum sp.]|nr:cytochrome c [Magnetospirillum sp.]